MKKLFSAVLALALVLSVTTAAFAQSQAPAYDVQPVVYKTYQVNNGTAPAQDFTFSFQGVSYTNGDGEVVSDANIPAIADASIHFDAITATEKKSTALDINADDYDLGVYKYLVTETAVLLTAQRAIILFLQSFVTRIALSTLSELSTMSLLTAKRQQWAKKVTQTLTIPVLLLLQSTLPVTWLI